MIELGYMKQGKVVTYAHVEREQLPNHLRFNTSDQTFRLIKEKEETVAGTTTQIWNRLDAISPKHIHGHRFTVRFEQC